MADRGSSLSKLQALVGHAEVKTTGIYLRPESARAALDPRAILGSRPAGVDAAILN